MILREGDIEIEFPDTAQVERFDIPSKHGLTHCMKAVDFVVTDSGRTFFLEIKDFEHPAAPPDRTSADAQRFLTGQLNEDLKHKFRDTFLYKWAEKKLPDPPWFVLLVALTDLTEAELLAQQTELQRILPVSLPETVKKRWKQPLSSGCLVFNMETWQRHFPAYRVRRKSAKDSSPRD